MALNFRTAAASSGFAFAVAACGGDSTAPLTPAKVTASSSVAMSGTVGLALATSPTFVVTDASGNTLSNVAVSVTVASGGGTLTGAPTKTASGPTSVGTWILGQTAGANSLTVTVNGVPPLTIVATGTPGPPTQITVASGGAQSAPAAGTLPAPLTFKVGDVFNNGVPGIPVTFAVSGGGGAVASTGPVTTDASGIAAAPAWTMGKSTGQQLLRAFAGSLIGTATASVASNFSLEVRFFGPPMDAAVQAAFTAAAARIQGIITGDIPAQPVLASATELANGCGITGTTGLNETIDDIVVYASVATLSPGILGSAGPCATRSGSDLPYLGVMEFNTSLIQSLVNDGRLTDLITHEMLHTVGVGTLWATKGQVSGMGTPSSAFIGLQAVAGCQFHGGISACATTVPLETTGGAGTRDVHWREASSATGIGFRTELMTGFVSAAGIPNPLSRITIGSLADIGYVVNLLPYDAYTVPSSLVASLQEIREAQGLGGFQLVEEVVEPYYMAAPSGRLIPRPVRR